jgi:hypothetical protein
MQTLIDVIKTTARISVGALLLCIGIAMALTASKNLSFLPPDASAAYISGRIVGASILPLIFGIVGFKMMTRRNLPSKSA